MEEEFISGFCRTKNAGNTVCCEYSFIEGRRKLEFMDCLHETCVHRGACEIYKQAHRLEEEG